MKVFIYSLKAESLSEVALSIILSCGLEVSRVLRPETEPIQPVFFELVDNCLVKPYSSTFFCEDVLLLALRTIARLGSLKCHALGSGLTRRRRFYSWVNLQF